MLQQYGNLYFSTAPGLPKVLIIPCGCGQRLSHRKTVGPTSLTILGFVFSAQRFFITSVVFNGKNGKEDWVASD